MSTLNDTNTRLLIAPEIYRNRLSLHLSKDPTFQAMVIATMNLSGEFEFTGRDKLTERLLESIHMRQINSIKDFLLNNTITFGVHLQEYGDHIKVTCLSILYESSYPPHLVP